MFASDRPESGPTLQTIVSRVEGEEVTLTLYNDDADQRVRDGLRSYFTVQTVALRRATTDDGHPRDFFVLHDDDEYLAAASLEDVYRAVNPQSSMLATTDPGRIGYPDLLREIDQTVFTDYGRQRMTIASREIEEHAYRHGGRLHAGFQSLSNAKPQTSLYRNLASAGNVETHLYGAGDWTPPGNHVLHEYDDPEILKSWFVVLDPAEKGHERALLAEERRAGEFYGFWTYDAEIVDTILDRLEAFPATTESGL
jgi:DICT domain-containing protein